MCFDVSLGLPYSQKKGLKEYRAWFNPFLFEIKNIFNFLILSVELIKVSGKIQNCQAITAKVSQKYKLQYKQTVTTELIPYC